MSKQEKAGDKLYTYAMQLFYSAGHIAPSEPEYINHSSVQFIFFDNKSDVQLSQKQRNLFESFDNVSRLFSENGSVFFSIHLLTTKADRSQIAHDIHTMLHPIVGAEGTVCLFQFDDEVMFSFIGFGLRCILSDWYPVADDNESLLEKVDIANIATNRSIDYFFDMVYMLARPYYLQGQPSTYELLPINFLSYVGFDELDRDAIHQYVQDQMNAPRQQYGDDYVGYDDSSESHHIEVGAALDLMLLEIETEDDSQYENENESGDDFDGEDYIDEDTDDSESDEYEYDDVDPNIFLDPTLMVKWLKKHE